MEIKNSDGGGMVCPAFQARVVGSIPAFLDEIEFDIYLELFGEGKHCEL